MDAVHLGDIALFRKRLDALIDLADEERWPESYVKYALVRVTLELMQLAGEHACEADVVSRIYRQAGYQDALGCVARLCADIESREENLTNRSVETIKQYIYKNYDKDLGLSELSEAFYFSPELPLSRVQAGNRLQSGQVHQRLPDEKGAGNAGGNVHEDQCCRSGGRVQKRVLFLSAL